MNVLPGIEVLSSDLFDDLFEWPFFILVQLGDQGPLLLPDVGRN